jgi:hypothetical protein
MRGYLDTNVWVLPDHGIVAARMQSRVVLHATRPVDEKAMFELLTSR